jgi:hypothetical protein
MLTTAYISMKPGCCTARRAAAGTPILADGSQNHKLTRVCARPGPSHANTTALPLIRRKKPDLSKNLQIDENICEDFLKDADA